MKKLCLNVKKIDLILEYGIYAVVFLLPWQARYFLKISRLNGEIFEYASLSVYALDIILLVVVLAGMLKLIEHWQRHILALRKISFLLLLPFGGFISVLWAGDKVLAAYFSLRLLLGILFVYAVYISNVKLVKFGFALLLGALGQSMIGIWQFLYQTDLFGYNKWLGVSAHLPAQPGSSVINSGGRRWLRAYGTLPHPNVLGGFCGVGVLLTVGWYTDIKKRMYGYYSCLWCRKYLKLEVFGVLFCLIVLSWGLMVSFSRSAFVGMFGGVFMYLFLFVFSGKGACKIKILVGLKIILIGAFLAVIFGGVYGGLLKTRLNTESRLEKKSLMERQLYLKQAQKIIKQNFWLGTGAGNYVPYLAFQLLPSRPQWYYQPVHNVYLLIVSEFGVLGLLFLAGAGDWFFKNLFFLRQSGFGNNTWGCLFFSVLFMFLIIGLFDHYLWSLFFGRMLFFVIFAAFYKFNVGGA